MLVMWRLLCWMESELIDDPAVWSDIKLIDTESTSKKVLKSESDSESNEPLGITFRLVSESLLTIPGEGRDVAIAIMSSVLSKLHASDHLNCTCSCAWRRLSSVAMFFDQPIFFFFFFFLIDTDKSITLLPGHCLQLG